MSSAATPQPEELTCRELVELVSDYLEGALPARDRLLFEQHLVFCPPCTTYVEQMRDTVRLVGRLTEEALPQETRDGLLQAFHEWRRG
jgi:predicted anti-sigma-YlaC factor YlaD